jgi:hypothetical protein
VAGIGSGNFSWRRIEFEYEPSSDASYVALEIWHGHQTPQPLPNRIWIDNVTVTEYQLVSDLDSIWIYSTQHENETLDDIFTSEEKSITTISYHKIDPTKYVVEVNTTHPFMLSFGEAYNPLWLTHGVDETIGSLPLYSAINGFWINQTGELILTLEYEPQKWLYNGSVVSIITLLFSIFFILRNYKKEISQLNNG